MAEGKAKVQTKILTSLMDNSDKLLNLAVAGGVGVVGARAFGYQPIGALIGLIGYRLAQSDNLASGTAGVTVLSALGLMNLPPQGILPLEKQAEAYEYCKHLAPNPAVLLMHPTLYHAQLSAFNQCLQRRAGLIP